MPKYTKKFIIFKDDPTQIYLYSEEVDARFVAGNIATLYDTLKDAVNSAKMAEARRHSRVIEFLDALKYSDFNA